MEKEREIALDLVRQAKRAAGVVRNLLAHADALLKGDERDRPLLLAAFRSTLMVEGAISEAWAETLDKCETCGEQADHIAFELSLNRAPLSLCSRCGDPSRLGEAI